MTYDEQLRHYGIPKSDHRMTLPSPLETERKWPVGWGLIAAVAFGVAVITAIIKFI